MNINNQKEIDQIFECILTSVEDVLPVLDHGQKYTLKKLVGDAEWKAIPIEIRPKLGTMFSEAVNTKKLPLQCYGTNSSNAKLYETI